LHIAIMHSATLHTATLHTATVHTATLHTATLHTATLHTATLHTVALHIATLRTATLHTAILHKTVYTLNGRSNTRAHLHLHFVKQPCKFSIHLDVYSTADLTTLHTGLSPGATLTFYTASVSEQNCKAVVVFSAKSKIRVHCCMSFRQKSFLTGIKEISQCSDCWRCGLQTGYTDSAGGS